MIRLLAPLLTFLGRGSPLIMGLFYAGVLLVLQILFGVGAAMENRVLQVIGVVLGIENIVILFCCGAWFRKEDTVSIGVLCGMILLIGTTIAMLMWQFIVTLSIGAAILGVLGSVIGTFLAALVVVPLSIGIIWLARRFSPNLGIEAVNAN